MDYPDRDANTHTATDRPATFDSKSAIRERLNLLAHVGPHDLSDWSYDPRFDRFFRFERGGKARFVQVTSEGSMSLDVISRRWRIGRKEAMAMIGYPERKS